MQPVIMRRTRQPGRLGCKAGTDPAGPEHSGGDEGIIAGQCDWRLETAGHRPAATKKSLFSPAGTAAARYVFLRNTDN